ncbi:hypothetical protein GCM10010387_03780 [Streptomyces inusitatus]|uniref:Lipoprotein n=1 Tax=Streptomyces inusitatus TaxID=68221 RepID=A0A918UJP1_9ACTN|nr:hypothetical protein [Streptomyces inusitatus]GGZ14812.1 hypothetical protein GCM10010387_03780 [Streptomyces inusitatus]
MIARWQRGMAGAGLAMAVAFAGAGCAEVGNTASDIASRAVASATAAVDRKLDDIKNGVDSKDEVTLGTPGKDSDGRTTVKVTAANTADSAKSFAVQVDFRDSGGNLLDTTLVTVSDVPAKGSKDGTARSNRKLSGNEVKTEVGRALRY